MNAWERNLNGICDDCNANFSFDFLKLGPYSLFIDLLFAESLPLSKSIELEGAECFQPKEAT